MLRVSSKSSGDKGLKQISLANRFGDNLEIVVEKKPVVFKNTQENQVWMLTSYPPRECGIATFSTDLKNAIATGFGASIQLKIAAIDNGIERSRYPKEVAFIFNSDQSDSYQQLAESINNNSTAKALIIQHEFGLFHRDKQADLLQMLNGIKKPVIIVMHTVLPHPSQSMKENVTAMAMAVDKVVVMTKNSAALLQEYYDIPASKVDVIPHGTHLVPQVSKELLKKKYDLDGKIVLSTFGLISRNKSIETSIKALPAIVKKHPEVVFLALGRTHPCVVKEEGESYRDELLELVKEHKLENNVRFVNRYLSLDEMLEYLQATDIYLFTSKDPQQAVSGTFSYALSAGCAIVSTPIPHAKEILESGCGLLFNFEDPQSLSKQILYYLENPSFRKKAGEMAMETIAPTSWENVANQYQALLKELSNEKWETQYELSPISLDHLKKMTTDVGLIQFSHYNEPDIASGYTLDDNARALIAASMHWARYNHNDDLVLIKQYLDFIKKCQLKDGSFLNYIDKDGLFTEQNKTENLEDANGRAMWALGYVVGLSKKLPAALGNLADKMFSKGLDKLHALRSPRAMCFLLKGLFHYSCVRSEYKKSNLFNSIGERLVQLYKANTDKSWRWFEKYLTYANSILPEAMLMAYRATGNSLFKQVSKESFDFLLSKIFINGRIKVICNQGWLNKGEKKLASFGEQPIDIAYTIMALDKFYALFKNEEYVKKIKTAYEWFLGRNHLGRIVYNPVTGGCYDGLEKDTVNLNQGAESTVCHLMARMVAEPYFTGYDYSKNNALQLAATSVA